MSSSHRKHLHSKEKRLAKRYLRNHSEVWMEHAFREAKSFSLWERARLAVLLVAGSHAGAVGRWWRSVTYLPRIAWVGLRSVSGHLLGGLGRAVRALVFAGIGPDEPRRRSKALAYNALLVALVGALQAVWGLPSRAVALGATLGLLIVYVLARVAVEAAFLACENEDYPSEAP